MVKETDLSPTSIVVENGTGGQQSKLNGLVKPPWYKRKKLVAGLVFAVVAIIVVTVTVPVVVIRNKNRNYTTGINGAFQDGRPTGPYTDVVIFGDGLADNGRPRGEQYAPSRAGSRGPRDPVVGGPYWVRFTTMISSTVALRVLDGRSKIAG